MRVHRYTFPSRHALPIDGAPTSVGPLGVFLPQGLERQQSPGRISGSSFLAEMSSHSKVQLQPQRTGLILDNEFLFLSDHFIISAVVWAHCWPLPTNSQAPVRAQHKHGEANEFVIAMAANRTASGVQDLMRSPMPRGTCLMLTFLLALGHLLTNFRVGWDG